MMAKEFPLIHISSSAAAVGRRTSLLWASNLLLTAVCSDSETKTINGGFLKGHIFADRNKFYTNNRNRRVLEDKDFDQLDPCFRS